MKRKKKSTLVFNPQNTKIAKNIILTTIVITMLTVLVYVIFSIIATPEFLVKREIESITADYYENYFYSNILKNNPGVEDHLSDILDEYSKAGFPRITLNQLLLYDNRKHYASAESISEYCDLNKTIIKIFPESPYTSKNYRVDYNYSCNF